MGKGVHGSGGLPVRGIFDIFKDFVLLFLFSLWFFAIDEVSNRYWVLQNGGFAEGPNHKSSLF